MKKIIFALSILLLVGNFTFAQEKSQKLPKKPKKIRVSDIVTYGLPPDLDLAPSRPLPSDFSPCPPVIIPSAPEVLEERLIILIYGKLQVFQITSGPDGTVLRTTFEMSNGMIVKETFNLGFQSHVIGLEQSEKEYGLIHFSYQHNGVVRFIDFYIP